MKKTLFLICYFSACTCFSFYPDSYENSKKHFIESAEQLKETFPDAQLNSLPIPTHANQSLTTETLYIPQSKGKRERILILTSGIHGVEAFAGSAIQFAFIEKILNSQLLESMGVLIIHAVNPYGYAFHRRVSENNVDLNRNFTADELLFKSNNEAYSKLNDFLNPSHPAKASIFHDIQVFVKSILLLIQHGKSSLTQAIVGGQYQFAKGISFGGHQLEPNVEILGKEFLWRAHPYKSVFHIDLHTGYGQRGKLHYFMNQSTIEKAPQLKEIFDGYDLDTEKKKDFYKTSGDFASFALQLFPDKVVIPMVFEFGTMNSQTIMGSFLSLKNMIYENQGFQNGFANDYSKEKVHADFLKMFNPPEKEWRTKIIDDSLLQFKTLLERYSKLTFNAVESIN